MTEKLNEISMEFIGLEGLTNFSHFPSLLLVLLILLLLWIAKKFFDLTAKYNLEYQLVKADNKAVTVSFAGYLGGVAIIMEGVLEGGSLGIWMDLINVFVWGIIGILLLFIAGKINDHLILRRFNNLDELLNQQNVAVGVVMAGSYIGSAMIIRSILLGEALGYALDILLTIVYFVIAQIFFVFYSFLYEKVVRYDYHKEIHEKNVAAGISFGINLVAIGILFAIPLRESWSFVYFLVWFIVGSSVMAFFRFIMDRIIIPLEKLDEEIHIDRNWGVALLEGCFAVTAVIILQAIFS